MIDPRLRRRLLQIAHSRGALSDLSRAEITTYSISIGPVRSGDNNGDLIHPLMGDFLDAETNFGNGRVPRASCGRIGLRASGEEVYAAWPPRR